MFLSIKTRTNFLCLPDSIFEFITIKFQISQFTCQQSDHFMNTKTNSNYSPKISFRAFYFFVGKLNVGFA